MKAKKFKLIHVFGPVITIQIVWFLLKVLGFFFGVDFFTSARPNTVAALFTALLQMLASLSVYWIPVGLIIYFVLKNKNKD